MPEYKCDRCGKIFNNKEKNVGPPMQIQFRIPPTKRDPVAWTSEWKDLCHECAADFMTIWLMPKEGTKF